MGYKYYVQIAKYSYEGCWERSEGFDTLDAAVKFIRDRQKEGYKIIDLTCRYFEV
jgi:hypothetical protein